MTRKNVKLAFITNDAARKATYKKRKKGFLKKANELSTLCGIEACAVIYSPYETKSEVWPNVSKAEKVMLKFRNMPEMQQLQNMMNQESFIKKSIVKVKEQLKKKMETNREKEMKEVIYHGLIGAGSGNFDIGELNHLERVLDKNIKEISKRFEMLNKGEDSKNEEVMHVEEQNPNVDFCMRPMNKAPRFNAS